MSLGSSRWKVVYFVASFSFGGWRSVISFCTSATVLDQQVQCKALQLASLCTLSLQVKYYFNYLDFFTGDVLFL